MASEGQNNDAQEINSAMKTLDDVTIHNSEISLKIGNTVVTLADQTKNLKGQVNELNKIIRGA
jgi:methyl-accepting chemotaxis protein